LSRRDKLYLLRHHHFQSYPASATLLPLPQLSVRIALFPETVWARPINITFASMASAKKPRLSWGLLLGLILFLASDGRGAVRLAVLNFLQEKTPAPPSTEALDLGAKITSLLSTAPGIELVERAEIDRIFRIGVGTRDETSPLPPNRTGGFPASGFPVSGSHRELAACARTEAKEISPSATK